MKRLFGFLLVVFIISPCILNAQWTKTNGPYGGNVLCMTTLGTNIFAGTFSDGIYI